MRKINGEVLTESLRAVQPRLRSRSAGWRAKTSRQSDGHVCPDHCGGIYASGAGAIVSDGDRLHAAVAAIKKVQIHGWFGCRVEDRLGKVTFDPEPFFLAHSIFDGRQIQIRPASGSVYQSARFKLSACSGDLERARSGDALDCDLLTGIHSRIFGGVPESDVEINPGDAGCRRIDLGLEHPAVHEYPRPRNADGSAEPSRVPAVE